MKNGIKWGGKLKSSDTMAFEMVDGQKVEKCSLENTLICKGAFCELTKFCSKFQDDGVYSQRLSTPRIRLREPEPRRRRDMRAVPVLLGMARRRTRFRPSQRRGSAGPTCSSAQDARGYGIMGDMESKKALVAEDNTAHYERYAALLAGMGLRVDRACDGVDALAMAKGGKTYRYGYLDKVLSVTDGDTTRTYTYHADGQLASATVGGVREAAEAHEMGHANFATGVMCSVLKSELKLMEIKWRVNGWSESKVRSEVADAILRVKLNYFIQFCNAANEPTIAWFNSSPEWRLVHDDKKDGIWLWVKE